MTDSKPSNDGFDSSDPIAAAWAEQPEPDDGAPILAADPSDLVDSVAKAHRKDQRRLFWLNIREVLPTPFIAGIFAFSATDSTHPWAVLVAAVVVLFPGSFLLTTSVRHHRADNRWGNSVRDQLARRLAQVEHRAWLYRYVGRWYFLPFLVVFALVGYGLGGSPENGGLILFGIGGLFSAIMYWVNRWIGRTQHEPEVKRFKALLADFDQTP